MEIFFSIVFQVILLESKVINPSIWFPPVIIKGKKAKTKKSKWFSNISHNIQVCFWFSWPSNSHSNPNIHNHHEDRCMLLCFAWCLKIYHYTVCCYCVFSLHFASWPNELGRHNVQQIITHSGSDWTPADSTHLSSSLRWTSWVPSSIFALYYCNKIQSAAGLGAAMMSAAPCHISLTPVNMMGNILEKCNSMLERLDTVLKLTLSRNCQSKISKMKLSEERNHTLRWGLGRSHLSACKSVTYVRLCWLTDDTSGYGLPADLWPELNLAPLIWYSAGRRAEIRGACKIAYCKSNLLSDHISFQSSQTEG